METPQNQDKNDSKPLTNNITNHEELFPVLNQAKIKKLSETDRKLPDWLTSPTQFSSEI